MNYDRIKQQAGHLPAFQIADTINSTLKESANLVVTAPPGAGKSTVLPLTLLEATPQGKILMLEPRRLAARQIAERMASILGEPVGKTVGYRVRFENKVSSETRIEVLTEGILTRMLIHDATLEGVSAVIFDEFHERSINSDLALALTRQAQEIIRPDLKIIIMSATIDASAICEALQAPLIESEGRMFPVETIILRPTLRDTTYIKRWQLPSSRLQISTRAIFWLSFQDRRRFRNARKFWMRASAGLQQGFSRTYRSAGLSALRQSPTREAAPRHRPIP